MSAIMSGKPNGHVGVDAAFVHGRDPQRLVNVDSRQSIARDERAQISTSLAEPLSMGTRVWYPNTTQVAAEA